MTEPQASTRERLLRIAWQEIRSVDETSAGRYPAARRAIEAGASPNDVVTAMSAAKYEAVFRLLFLLSGEHAEEGNYDATTGWSIVEAELRDDGSAVPTGSDALRSVHEDLLSSDPGGTEGANLFR